MGRRGPQPKNFDPKAVARRNRQVKKLDKDKAIGAAAGLSAEQLIELARQKGAPVKLDESSIEKISTAPGSVELKPDASSLPSLKHDAENSTKIPTLQLPAFVANLFEHPYFWKLLDLRQSRVDDFNRLSDLKVYTDSDLVEEVIAGNYGGLQMLIDRYPDLIRLKRDDVKPWLKSHQETRHETRQSGEAGGRPPLKGGPIPPPPGFLAVGKQPDQTPASPESQKNGTYGKTTNGLHLVKPVHDEPVNLPVQPEPSKTGASSFAATNGAAGDGIVARLHSFDVLSTKNVTSRELKEEVLWYRQFEQQIEKRFAFAMSAATVFAKLAPRMLAADDVVGQGEVEAVRREFRRVFPESDLFRTKEPVVDEVAVASAETRPTQPVVDEEVPEGFNPDDEATWPAEWNSAWRGGVWRNGQRILPWSLPPVPVNERLCAFIVKMFALTKSDSYLERTWSVEEQALLDEVYSQALGLVGGDTAHAYALLLTWMNNYGMVARREPRDGTQISHTPAELMQNLVKYAKPNALDYPKEGWTTPAMVLERLKKFRERYLWGAEHER
jgi:hypothetical protein